MNVLTIPSQGLNMGVNSQFYSESSRKRLCVIIKTIAASALACGILQLAAKAEMIEGADNIFARRCSVIAIIGSGLGQFLVEDSNYLEIALLTVCICILPITLNHGARELDTVPVDLGSLALGVSSRIAISMSTKCCIPDS